MKNTTKTRVSAIMAIGWAMLCPIASFAQSPDTNSVKIHGIHHEQLVSIGHDVELNADDSAEQVVVIGGSAKIHGTVHGQVVVVGGNAEIDGHVADQVVVVLGNVQVGETGDLGAELVCVGGETQVAKGGKVHGEVTEVGAGLSNVLGLSGLKDWFEQCVMKLRPLAPGVGWVWWFAGFFLLLYFLIAVLFPHPVQRCVDQISARPATTLAAGILAKVAIPILCVFLPITIVGIAVVPFLLVGAVLTVMVGKTALLECVGGKVMSAFGLSMERQRMVGFLIGAVLLTVLYIVPVVGLFTLFVFGVWALGAGVTAICVAIRASRALAQAPIAAVPTPAGEPSAPAAPILAPPQALAYPRAGFWERMAAGFLDMVIIMLSAAAVGPFASLVALAYFAGMWAWKGTTVGGIVLNLQVVRQDGQPLNFLTAIVRCLAALFSACVLFLGFFWIGWDRDKQGWHDKIAGTVVVRLPRAVSLVCL